MPKAFSEKKGADAGKGNNMEPSIKKPVKLTREHLYERVWQKPMATLAAELGISGNGLAKICDQLEVPYPSRG